MAGNDSQKEFLTLIRGFQSEKSQGELRIRSNNRQIQELQSVLSKTVNAIEEAKHQKDSIEREIQAYEAELARNDSLIQTLEERIVTIQDELSALGSEIEALKKEDAETQDRFLEKMFALNAKIREFRESIASIIQENCSNSTLQPVSKACSSNAKAEDAETFRRDIQSKLAQIVSQITKEEEECQIEQYNHGKLEEELNTLEKKASLIERITEETLEMQELAKQISELEGKCASLGDELHRRSFCPRCQMDNTEALGEILQASDEN